MNKQELISTLSAYVKSGVISKEEVLSACEIGQTVSTTNPESVLFEGKKSFSATNILYVIGTLILLIGIGTLLFRFWSDLSSLVRIVLTLGIGVAAYMSGIILRSDTKTAGIAAVTQAISGVLLPIGIFITINEIGIQHIDISWIAAVAVILALFYIVSFLLFRSVMFSFFSIAFSTWALYSGIEYVLVQSSSEITSDIYKYLTLAVGAAYLFFSSSIKHTTYKALGSFLDTFGSLAVFGAVLVLSDYKPHQSFLWEIIGILMLCGGLYLASVTQNRRILKVTSLFIFIFIAKFTGEYFADSFGWPIALIIGGLALIGVGFGLVNFNKRIAK